MSAFRYSIAAGKLRSMSLNYPFADGGRIDYKLDFAWFVPSPERLQEELRAGGEVYLVTRAQMEELMKLAVNKLIVE